MTVRREHELWALALWVEQEHLDEAERFIAERVIHFHAEGDHEKSKLWMAVAHRYVGLRLAPSVVLN